MLVDKLNDSWIGDNCRVDDFAVLMNMLLILSHLFPYHALVYDTNDFLFARIWCLGKYLLYSCYLRAKMMFGTSEIY